MEEHKKARVFAKRRMDKHGFVSISELNKKFKVSHISAIRLPFETKAKEWGINTYLKGLLEEGHELIPLYPKSGIVKYFIVRPDLVPILTHAFGKINKNEYSNTLHWLQSIEKNQEDGFVEASLDNVPAIKEFSNVGIITKVKGHKVSSQYYTGKLYEVDIEKVKAAKKAIHLIMKTNGLKKIRSYRITANKPIKKVDEPKKYSKRKPVVKALIEQTVKKDRYIRKLVSADILDVRYQRKYGKKATISREHAPGPEHSYSLIMVQGIPKRWKEDYDNYKGNAEMQDHLFQMNKRTLTGCKWVTSMTNANAIAKRVHEKLKNMKVNPRKGEFKDWRSIRISIHTPKKTHEVKL